MFALLVLCSPVAAPTQGRSGGGVLDIRWPDSPAARPLADRTRSSQTCSLSFGPPAAAARRLRSVVDRVVGVHDTAREPLRADQPEPSWHVGGQGAFAATDDHGD